MSLCSPGEILHPLLVTMQGFTFISAHYAEILHSSFLIVQELSFISAHYASHFIHLRSHGEIPPSSPLTLHDSTFIPSDSMPFSHSTSFFIRGLHDSRPFIHAYIRNAARPPTNFFFFFQSIVDIIYYVTL